MKTIAIFGGTFDPVHNGHLHSALELKQRLVLDELYLLPCHIPPHRQQPGVSSQDRLAMVKLAVGDSGLLVDDRELSREQPSYSVETLRQYRQQYGDQVSLIWVMGTDAFAHFDRWHLWQEFLTLAHIIVITRPSEKLPETGPVANLIVSNGAKSSEQLKQQSAGLIWFESLTPYFISATAIRGQITMGNSVADQLSAPVIDYIKEHQLYAG